VGIPSALYSNLRFNAVDSYAKYIPMSFWSRKRILPKGVGTNEDNVQMTHLVTYLFSDINVYIALLLYFRVYITPSPNFLKLPRTRYLYISW